MYLHISSHVCIHIYMCVHAYTCICMCYIYTCICAQMHMAKIVNAPAHIYIGINSHDVVLTCVCTDVYVNACTKWLVHMSMPGGSLVS